MQKFAFHPPSQDPNNMHCIPSCFCVIDTHLQFLHFNPRRLHSRVSIALYGSNISESSFTDIFGSYKWWALQNWWITRHITGRASPPLSPPSPPWHPLTSMAMPCNGASNQLHQKFTSPCVEWFLNGSKLRYSIQPVCSLCPGLQRWQLGGDPVTRTAVGSGQGRLS